MAARLTRTKVKADLKNNRLTVTLGGTINKAELESVYTDIRFCVGDLQQNFDVITDMRDCRIGYLSAAPVFRRIVEFLKVSGVGRVVRVSGRSKVILHQISRVTKVIGGYSPIYVSNLEEAEEILSKERMA